MSDETPAGDAAVQPSPPLLERKPAAAEAPIAAADAPASLSRYLLYTLSLPERTVRSTIAMAAGAATHAAEFLVPRAFQDSKTYSVVVRNSLKFLTKDVGGVARQGTDENPTADDFLARKTVGNFVDLAGMATLHVSPLWILAIVSDVAYGSTTYVRELAAELKQQGLIDDASTIHHVDDVLEAVRRASGEAAGLFDTPPLSLEQLKASLDETRKAVQSADYLGVLPESEVKRYWQEMKEISTRDGVSLLGVSGALSLHALGKVTTVARGTFAGVQVAGSLVNRHVIEHYTSALAALKERGLYASLRETAEPYLEAVWNNFSGNKTTLTEDVVTGRALTRWMGKIAGWFGRKPTPQMPPASSTDGGETLPSAAAGRISESPRE